MTTPRVRATTQERSSTRQRALGEAAATLLIQHGPDAVTHRRVAEAAGVPAGSANYYFPSKAGLYQAAVRGAEELRRDSAMAYALAIPECDRTPEETARRLIETFYAPALNANVVAIRLEPMLAAYRDPDLRATMAEFRPGHLAALRVVLDRSGRAAVADGPDVDLLAQMIDASLLYAGLTGDRDPIGAAATSVGRLLELADRA
ncbi:TetR/AcrR family transcriptional regulator [Aeromicrobium sp. A1-2]|uniref:TetR/AcrR family transcriptional regulator n=1 Tax=Aeromicrobium sp. A1-2 TaxID=2107713 RepID=UPI0013C2F44B|nr:TetR/AcrR family transcriptional regulator [Aeromicrobium sp. A1-2]